MGAHGSAGTRLHQLARGRRSVEAPQGTRDAIWGPSAAPDWALFVAQKQEKELLCLEEKLKPRPAAAAAAAAQGDVVIRVGGDDGGSPVQDLHDGVGFAQRVIGERLHRRQQRR